jgi:hypothetical protein
MGRRPRFSAIFHHYHSGSLFSQNRDKARAAAPGAGVLSEKVGNDFFSINYVIMMMR